jgi:hypothetical protein
MSKGAFDGRLLCIQDREVLGEHLQKGYRALASHRLRIGQSLDCARRLLRGGAPP